MEKHNKKIALLLGAGLLIAQPATSFAKGDDDHVTITPQVGFKYQHVAEIGEMKDYMDQYRELLEPFRPGFSDMFVNFPQMPMLTLDVLVNPQWHILSKDMLDFMISAGFGSSAIFGSMETNKTLQTTVSALEFGDTNVGWKQEAKNAGFVGVGVVYDPYEFRLSDRIRSGLALVLRGGFSWYRGQSTLEGEILDNTLFEQLGIETLNSVEIYKKTKTVTNSSGEGGFLDLMLGLVFKAYDVRLDVRGGYKFNWLQNFTMTENRDFDGIPTVVKTTIDYEQFGLTVEAMVGYEF